MKLSDIVPFIIIPSLAFYGVVYDNKLSINILEIQAFIMLILCLIGFYYVAFTDQSDEFIENYDIKKSSHGTCKQKFGYSLVVASACLLISYDHLLLGVLLVVPVFVNEYIADRIINANQQKTKG